MELDQKLPVEGERIWGEAGEAFLTCVRRTSCWRTAILLLRFELDTGMFTICFMRNGVGVPGTSEHHFAGQDSRETERKDFKSKTAVSI